MMYGDCDNEWTMEPSLTMESIDPRPPISLDSTLVELKATQRYTPPSIIPGTIILVEAAEPSTHSELPRILP